MNDAATIFSRAVVQSRPTRTLTLCTPLLLRPLDRSINNISSSIDITNHKHRTWRRQRISWRASWLPVVCLATSRLDRWSRSWWRRRLESVSRTLARSLATRRRRARERSWHSVRVACSLAR